MANVKTKTDKWLASTITALIRKYDDMGLRASGKYAESLTPFTEFREGGFKIGVRAAKHSLYMERGIVAQSNPSPDKAKQLYPVILQWIKDKGLGFDNSAAFRIALSIVYKGVKVPNRYNKGDVVSSVITRNRIDDLLKSVGLVLREDIKSSVIKEFK